MFDWYAIVPCVAQAGVSPNAKEFENSPQTLGCLMLRQRWHGGVPVMPIAGEVRQGPIEPVARD